MTVNFYPLTHRILAKTKNQILLFFLRIQQTLLTTRDFFFFFFRLFTCIRKKRNII